MNIYFHINNQSIRSVVEKASIHRASIKCPRNVFLCEDSMCCALALPWFCSEEQKGEDVNKILKRLRNFKQSLHPSDMCKDEKEKAVSLGKSHTCICREVREMENQTKIDELVWKMVGVAHEIIGMDKELKKYYPEMIFFLNYLVSKYPALKEKK